MAVGIDGRSKSDRTIHADLLVAGAVFGRRFGQFGCAAVHGAGLFVAGAGIHGAGASCCLVGAAFGRRAG